MRHLKAGRKLGRNASHRRALLRNLTRALIQYERIITTVEKAKEVRPFVEKLITLGKKGTLHARRLALQRLPDREIVAKIFDVLGPRYADRSGGYTRIIKRPQRRLGDAGKTAFLELLKEGEEKVHARVPAPAPIVAEPEIEPETESQAAAEEAETAPQPATEADTAEPKPEDAEKPQG